MMKRAELKKLIYHELMVFDGYNLFIWLNEIQKHVSALPCNYNISINCHKAINVYGTRKKNMVICFCMSPLPPAQTNFSRVFFSSLRSKWEKNTNKCGQRLTRKHLFIWNIYEIT